MSSRTLPMRRLVENFVGLLLVSGVVLFFYVSLANFLPLPPFMGPTIQDRLTKGIALIGTFYILAFFILPKKGRAK